MAKKVKNKRFWNFKRNYNQDRSYLDFFGARKEPSVEEGLTSAKTFLEDLVEEVGARDGVSLDELKKAWAQVVGLNIANNSEPLEINNGALRIRVSQPVIKFELQQQKGLILKKIKEQIPAAKVKSIDVVI